MTRGSEIQSVIQEGKRIRTVHLDVRVLASPRATSRVGIVVPRHRHSAVDRNRLKRRLRELVRLDLLPVLKAHAAVDVAIRARHQAYDASFDAVRVDVRTIRTRLDPSGDAGTAGLGTPGDHTP